MLLFGREAPTPQARRVYQKQLGDLRSIWYQTHYRDFGIERLLRLLLKLLSFVMPGTLFRAAVSLIGRGFLLRRSSIEAFALLKPVWYIMLFKLGLTTRPGFMLASAILTFDTLHFLLSRIFLADMYRGHTSFKRTLLLVIINFGEMALFFATLYTYLDHELRMMGQHAFNVAKLSGVQAVYFSFVTATTVGYGDIHPVAPLLMKVVVAQIGISLFFVVVYFSTVISNLDKAGVLNEGNQPGK